jgi:hypothetical protein
MKRHISHGEVNLFEVNEIPSTAKRLKLRQEDLVKGGFKLADSETTGNHHLVKLTKGVEIYEDVDGTIYIRNTQPTTVECVDVARHDTINLPASRWKRKISREVNHLTNLIREVAD